MKCSELYRLLVKAGWVAVRQKESHLKLIHPNHANPIIFPNHGSKEIGKGLELKIKKEAGL